MSGRYLYTWLSVALSTLLLAAAFNAAVDPYGLIGTPRIAGWNAIKPAASTRSRTVKSYVAARFAPSVLIVGNSRPEAGLDPKHPCLQEIGRTYSLTLPGAYFYHQVRAMQHALAYSEPKLVLLAVDFLDFLVDPQKVQDPHVWPPNESDFDRRLVVDAGGTPNPAYAWQKAKDYRNALLSLTAFEDSVRTLFAQHDPLTPTVSSLGFNPANEYRAIVMEEGQQILFRKKVEEVAQRLGAKEWRIFTPGYRWSPALEALERALTMIKAKGADVVVFINPYHAEYMRTLERAGYAALFERWKQVLTELVVTRHHAPLWDFAWENRYTTEPPPQLNGRVDSMLAWFWEPAHYRKELGDRMLYQMLSDYGCHSGASEPSAGRRLP